MSVTGPMSTTNVLSDQLAIDLSDKIKMLEPSSQPLAVWSRAAETRKTIATKFNWLESRSKARFDTTSGAVASTTVTAIPVSHGSYFQQWDQVLNTRTGEQMRVDAVIGDTLTVTRGIGSTAANLNSGDELYIIGSAQPEGDTSKDARSNNPSKVGNYTQIFRTPFEVTESLDASSFQVSPAEWRGQMLDKGIEHAKDLELSFILGRKSATTPGSQESRTTGGILSFITTNQTDAGGDLSEAEFNAWMAQFARYSSGQALLALASTTAVSALNKFPASKQQTKNDETTYGMSVTHYTSPFGSLNLVYHPLLEGTKYGGYLIGLNMDQIAYRPLGNDQKSRDTKVLNNRQAPDADTKKSEYLTEAGLEFGLTEKHGVLTGITS